jgi:acylglycerol lipase
MEYLRVTRALSADGCARLKAFSMPFVVFHGDGDTLTDPKGSRDLHVHAASKDKTLRILEGRWHILTKEPGNREVLREIVEWCDGRGGKVE